MFEALSLPSLPPVEVLLPCGLIALISAFGACITFGPLIVVSGEAKALAAGRAFYARSARQLSQLSFLMGVLAHAAAIACFFFFRSSEPQLWAFPWEPPFLAAAGAAGSAFLLQLLYTLCWPKKALPGKGHVFLGYLNALAALAAFFLCALLLLRLTHTPLETPGDVPWQQQMLDFCAVPRESFFWPALLESLPLGIAFAAATGSLWLLLCRNIQDYGRDYYAFALPALCKWALIFGLLAIPAGVYTVLRSQEIMLPELSHYPSRTLYGLALVLPLFAALLWIRIVRHPHPMRLKISTVLAWLSLVVGFAAQLLILSKIIPSP